MANEYQGTSIVDYLKSIGQNSSYQARASLASQYGRSRGTGIIGQDGSCIITPESHFILVTEPEGLVTVNLTATEEDQGLYVYRIEKNEYIEVRGKSGSSFMYEILAIRKGYLNSKVEIDN